MDLKPPRSPRYYSLDIWRGVACLMVVVFHSITYSPYYQSITRGAAYEAGGGLSGRLAHWMQVICSELWLGVPMFFVISGYCITAAIDSQRRRKLGIGQYFKRRFRRIYPPYWIALLATILVVTTCYFTGLERIFSDEASPFYAWELSASQWLGNLTLTETWRHHIVGSGEGHLMGIMWTLCYEEQFYAVAGLILLLAPRRIFLAAVAVTLLTILVRVLATTSGWAHRGFFFDGYWLQFALGILVYYRVNYASRHGVAAINGALSLGLLFAVPFRHLLPSEIDRSTVAATCFALFLSLTHRFDQKLFRHWALAGLRYSGAICYSMYLIHWPVCKIISRWLYLNGFNGPWQTLLVTVPLCVAASIAFSGLFYQLVERRFMNQPVGRASEAKQTQNSSVGRRLAQTP